MKITLAWYEVAACAATGVTRRIEALRKGIKAAAGFDLGTQIWDVDIQGACGEMAAAKALDKYWSGGVNTFHAGDVGRLQVKTARKANGPLYVQQRGKPDDLYILVQGTAPEFTVSGWVEGREAMQEKYLKSHHGRVPVYTVPASDMHPLGEINALHQAEGSGEVRRGGPGRPRPNRQRR